VAPPSPKALMSMDRYFLSIILASVLLLVIAFALATPGLKKDGSPDKWVVSRITTR
jgi:hypothetical protein